MKDFSKDIEAYALKNAIEHGSAEPSKVLPKLFQSGLKKSDIGKVMPLINEIVKKVNKMSPEERAKRYPEISSLVKLREERTELKDLPELKKKMVFRLAPYPSGDLHLGNARTYLLNALYAEMYGGKMILVMDDTIGSEEKQATKRAYKLIESSLKWMDINYEKKIVYKSDRLPIYYRYAKQLIRKGKAYVDFDSPEKIQRLRKGGKKSSERDKPPRAHLKYWEEMFDMKPGGAVLRIKTSMTHPNPAFRDRILFKISDRKHPRVGKEYRVWPSLEMSWAIDDHLLGITHIIRGNDLVMETKMEKYIWDIFGWKYPTIVHSGLVRLEGVGAKMSKSKAQKEVKSGEFAGWDDPRTWSIHSLKRRGFRKETIREFVKSMGMTSHDSIVPVDSLYAINRKLIDKDSDRYSFILNPSEIEIENKPEIKSIEIPIHPHKKEKRALKVDKIFISTEDLKNLRGEETRLINLYNIELDKKKPKAKFTSLENKDVPKINWVSSYVPAKILMPSGKWIEGIADSGIKRLKKGKTIQFERFGFARFDKLNKGVYEFWFAHK